MVPDDRPFEPGATPAGLTAGYRAALLVATAILLLAGVVTATALRSGPATLRRQSQALQNP